MATPQPRPHICRRSFPPASLIPVARTTAQSGERLWLPQLKARSWYSKTWAELGLTLREAGGEAGGEAAPQDPEDTVCCSSTQRHQAPPEHQPPQTLTVHEEPAGRRLPALAVTATIHTFVRPGEITEGDVTCGGRPH